MNLKASQTHRLLMKYEKITNKSSWISDGNLWMSISLVHPCQNVLKLISSVQSR